MKLQSGVRGDFCSRIIAIYLASRKTLLLLCFALDYCYYLHLFFLCLMSNCFMHERHFLFTYFLIYQYIIKCWHANIRVFSILFHTIDKVSSHKNLNKPLIINFPAVPVWKKIEKTEEIYNFHLLLRQHHTYSVIDIIILTVLPSLVHLIIIHLK